MTQTEMRFFTVQTILMLNWKANTLSSLVLSGFSVFQVMGFSFWQFLTNIKPFVFRESENNRSGKEVSHQRFAHWWRNCDRNFYFWHWNWDSKMILAVFSYTGATTTQWRGFRRWTRMTNIWHPTAVFWVLKTWRSSEKASEHTERTSTRSIKSCCHCTDA